MRHAQRSLITMMRHRASRCIHLARHLVAATVIAGMLSIPATCAQAAGPHSLYLPPAGPWSAEQGAGTPIVPVHGEIFLNELHPDSARANVTHTHAALGQPAPGAWQAQERVALDEGAPLVQRPHVRELPHPAMTALALVAALPGEPAVTLPPPGCPLLGTSSIARGRSIPPVSPPPRA
ncbi:MAG: hypothetical protein C4346_12795 [Chloroflexota bacterium]